jgi:hypothetical protein
MRWCSVGVCGVEVQLMTRDEVAGPSPHDAQTGQLTYKHNPSHSLLRPSPLFIALGPTPQAFKAFTTPSHSFINSFNSFIQYWVTWTTRNDRIAVTRDFASPFGARCLFARFTTSTTELYQPRPFLPIPTPARRTHCRFHQPRICIRQDQSPRCQPRRLARSRTMDHALPLRQHGRQTYHRRMDVWSIRP